MKALRNEISGILTKAEAMNERQLERLESLLSELYDCIAFKRKSVLTNTLDAVEKARYLESSEFLRKQIINKIT